jgi:hypothetical protein
MGLSVCDVVRIMKRTPLLPSLLATRVTALHLLFSHVLMMKACWFVCSTQI